MNLAIGKQKPDAFHADLQKATLTCLQVLHWKLTVKLQTYNGMTKMYLVKCSYFTK